MRCYYAKEMIITDVAIIVLLFVLAIGVIWVGVVQDRKIREVDFKIDTHIYPTSGMAK